MTKITEDIKLIQDLFDAYGIKYMTAKGEADVLCASLVIKKKVYAVLTEDMDLFAYTCPYVLRYFSLANHTCILYDLKKILTKLNINKKILDYYVYYQEMITTIIKIIYFII